MFLESLNDYELDYDLNTNEPGPVADPAAGFDIAFEATTQWHNIELAMIRAEHAAIVTENHALMEEAKDSWWDKIKSFFSHLMTRLKEFWSNALSMWYGLFNSHIKWLNANETRLKKIKDNDVKAKGYKYDEGKIKAAEDAVADQYGLAEKTSEEMSVDDVKKAILKAIGVDSKEYNNFTSELFKAFRSGKKDKEEQEFSIAEKITELRDSGKAIVEKKSMMAAMIAEIKKGLALAETAQRSGSTSDSDKVLIARVKSLKSVLTVAQIVSSSTMAAQRDMQVFAFSALKAAVSKGKDKEEKEKEDEGSNTPAPAGGKKKGAKFTGNVLDAFM